MATQFSGVGLVTGDGMGSLLTFDLQRRSIPLLPGGLGTTPIEWLWGRAPKDRELGFFLELPAPSGLSSVWFLRSHSLGDRPVNITLHGS